MYSLSCSLGTLASCCCYDPQSLWKFFYSHAWQDIIRVVVVVFSESFFLNNFENPSPTSILTSSTPSPPIRWGCSWSFLAGNFNWGLGGGGLYGYNFVPILLGWHSRSYQSKTHGNVFRIGRPWWWPGRRLDEERGGGKTNGRTLAC
jgi:hypothetical protein